MNYKLVMLIYIGKTKTYKIIMLYKRQKSDIKSSKVLKIIQFKFKIPTH